MYTLLRFGDKLPTVGVLQVMLNRGIAGRKLVKDGHFGGNTKSAVQQFQRPRGLGFDGVVGERTWPRVIRGTDFEIVDAVDITDPDLLSTEATDLRRAGGRPGLAGSMCNGIEQVINDIESRMRGRQVVLVRFFGHGGPGAFGVSDGVGSVRIGRRRVDLTDDDMSSLTPGTVRRGADILARLRFYFNEYSSVELHGCRVAGDAAGRRMLRSLADIWGVPVTAGIRYQYAGGTSTFRFEGPTVTACPGGKSLKEWCTALPNMAEVSVT